MKSIQLKILLSFLLLASHKANSMAWEECIISVDNFDQVIAESNRQAKERAEIMAENKRSFEEANAIHAARNAQQDQATEPQAAASSTTAGTSTPSQEPDASASTAAATPADTHDDTNTVSLTPPASPKDVTDIPASTAATTISNTQEDSATPPATTDAPSASSTTIANPETYELSAWGWKPASTNKAPENGDADGAPLSTDHSHDVCASTDDADTHADTQGPLPSCAAPTDDDSEPATVAASNIAPQATAATSTLPTEYAFITAGDSSQRAEEELLTYAQYVFNGVRDCIAALNDPCLNNNELKQDALDAQSLVNWATALHKQSKDNRSFILVPKSTLDACLARLKKLSEKFCKNQPTLKVEINYSNPKGMGDIDIFDIPLNLMPEQATQAAASSASAHPLTDDNSVPAHSDNDNDGDSHDDCDSNGAPWTTDEEEAGQSFDSQSAPHAEAPQAEYSFIDNDALLSYAQAIRADIETKLKEMSEDEKPLWQETISCDFDDAIEIIVWTTTLKNSKATAIPTNTIEKIVRRLHQLALTYSKKDRTIVALPLNSTLASSTILFDQEINIYSSQDASSNDDESNSEFSSSSGDDSDTNTQPKKTDSKNQSDGSTSDDEDDTSSVLSEDDSTGKKPLKNQKAPDMITSSFTGNILKLVKNKLVLAGGAVVAAIWYWQYYYAPDEDGADQPA